MEVSDVMSNVIPVLLGLLVLAGVWVAVEIALTIRKARKETVQKANDAIDKAMPLLDEAQVTLDAANLEIMRVDGILEDVSQITGGISSATHAVGNIASTPKNVVTSIADRVHLGNRDKARSKRTMKAVAQGKEAPVIAAGTEEKQPAKQSDTKSAAGFTVIEPSVVRPFEKMESPAADSAPADDKPIEAVTTEETPVEATVAEPATAEETPAEA